MSKITSAAAPKAARHSMTTRTLAGCALLAAMSVVLARFVIPMPAVDQRFSLEAVPIFIAGMLFGPIPGALVGFSADLVGCLFSGYGYNPLFCVPPILYGLAAGLFQPLLVRKTNVWTIALLLKKTTPLTIGLSFLPPIALGSILYQSATLAYVYGKGAFLPNFLVKLSTRSVQFAITFVLDVLVVYLLYKSKVFTAVRLWPAAQKTEDKE